MKTKQNKEWQIDSDEEEHELESYKNDKIIFSNGNFILFDEENINWEFE